MLYLPTFSEKTQSQSALKCVIRSLLYLFGSFKLWPEPSTFHAKLRKFRLGSAILPSSHFQALGPGQPDSIFGASALTKTPAELLKNSTPGSRSCAVPGSNRSTTQQSQSVNGSSLKPLDFFHRLLSLPDLSSYIFMSVRYMSWTNHPISFEFNKFGAPGRGAARCPGLWVPPKGWIRSVAADLIPSQSPAKSKQAGSLVVKLFRFLLSRFELEWL